MINIDECYKFQGWDMRRDNRVSHILVCLVGLFLISSPVSAIPPSTPTLTSDTNGTSQYLKLNVGTVITFTAASAGATSYVWIVDSRINSTVTGNTFIIPAAYHTISVKGRNADGNSSATSATIVTNPVWATNPVSRPNDTNYYTFEGILMNPDVVTVVNFVPSPYTSFMGNFFYLFLWFMVFGMIWIRTDKNTVPTTLGFIIGGIVVGTMPAQYQLIAQLVVVGGMFVALYLFLRDRR